MALIEKDNLNMKSQFPVLVLNQAPPFIGLGSKNYHLKTMTQVAAINLAMQAHGGKVFVVYTLKEINDSLVWKNVSLPTRGVFCRIEKVDIDSSG